MEEHQIGLAMSLSYSSKVCREITQAARTRPGNPRHQFPLFLVGHGEEGQPSVNDAVRIRYSFPHHLMAGAGETRDMV